MVLSEEMVRWFLDHGSDPNSRCDWDITGLTCAIMRASLSTIRLMLRYGGDARKGEVLHISLERTTLHQLAVIDMLISFGVPLNTRMYENDASTWVRLQPYGMGTPLHRAAEVGNANAVALLLRRGASEEILDSMGRTALDLARGKDHHEIVQMIQNRCTLT